MKIKKVFYGYTFDNKKNKMQKFEPCWITSMFQPSNKLYEQKNLHLYEIYKMKDYIHSKRVKVTIEWSESDSKYDTKCKTNDYKVKAPNETYKKYKSDCCNAKVITSDIAPDVIGDNHMEI